MYAPMIDRGETIGVIQVTADGRNGRGGFSRGDLDLLNGMATPAAIMLQNTRMYEASLARDRLNHDLELAAQIQKSFLPREVISVEGLDLYAVYRAAYTVGGDFYDVFWVGPDRLAVFIGDISGKGVSAALLMARISSELRVAAMAQVEPVAVLSMMNTATLMHARSEFFFTAIYLTLDVKTGEVVLANAGHCTPYWCHADGRVEAVTAGGRRCRGHPRQRRLQGDVVPPRTRRLPRPLHRRRRGGFERRRRSLWHDAPRELPGRVGQPGGGHRRPHPAERRGPRARRAAKRRSHPLHLSAQHRPTAVDAAAEEERVS